MSRDSGREGRLFIGRLSRNTRVKDLEDVFESYGRLVRCDIKYGPEQAYGFIDFEDRRDAQDALRNENGRRICGSSIIVEWAKGPRRPGDGRGDGRGFRGGGGGGGGGGGSSNVDCYKCGRRGHFARDCSDGDRRGSGSDRFRSRSPDQRGRRSRSSSGGRRY